MGAVLSPCTIRKSLRMGTILVRCQVLEIISRLCATLQGGGDKYDALSLEVMIRKRAI